MAGRIGDEINYPKMDQDEGWFGAIKRKIKSFGESVPAAQPAAAPAPAASSPVDPDKWKKFQQGFNK